MHLLEKIVYLLNGVLLHRGIMNAVIFALALVVTCENHIQAPAWMMLLLGNG
jgi:hypothetical protein